VHETEKEAKEETLKMLNVYAAFAREYLALPVIQGKKTESEKFPGAVTTYCIEAMMQDRKALQSGTSHFLGQNFAKASEIRFQNRKGEIEYAWTTSWGVSTRLIGAIIMVHSDDNGLVLPPKIAPSHIAVIPIYRDAEEKKQVMTFAEKIQNSLKGLYLDDVPLYTELDTRDMTSSERNWYWIKKGIPLRLEIGPRDIVKDSVMLARRDKEPKEKHSVNIDNLADYILNTLTEIQMGYYQKALDFKNKWTIDINDKEEFYRFFTPENIEEPEISGGFANSYWCGNPSCEEKIKEDLKVTIRCIPFAAKEESGKCICCGKPSTRRVIFAKAY
jgi:prolyl-tRNA synthetase